MRTLLPLLVTLVLLPLGGCAGDGPAASDPLVVISGPEAFNSFALLDEQNRVLWRLVAERPAPVDALFYGRVPQGFRQETPADGSAPRALMLGEPLRLESVTPRRVFQHEGWAASSRRLSIEYWEMKLRTAPEAPRLDDAALPPYQVSGSAGQPGEEVKP